MPRKKLDNVRTHIMLTKKQHAELDELAEKEGYSMSELIRRAVDMFLGAKRRQKKNDE